MQDGFSGWHGCTLPKPQPFHSLLSCFILREQNPLLQLRLGLHCQRVPCFSAHARGNGRTDNPATFGPIACISRKFCRVAVRGNACSIRGLPSAFLRAPYTPVSISGLILFLLLGSATSPSVRPAVPIPNAITPSTRMAASAAAGTYRRFAPTDSPGRW